MSWLELLLIVSILWPWWACGATIIGQCCCNPPLPTCCVPCKQYAEANQLWPCYWSLTPSSNFSDGSDACSLFGILQTVAAILGTGSDCTWRRVLTGFPFPEAKLYYNAAATAFDLDYSLGSPTTVCAKYRLALASWTYCGSNVMAQVSTACSCSAYPASVTVAPYAVGGDATCACPGVTQCPLLLLPDTLHATISDIGGGNSCFATPQSVAINWTGSIWDSGTVTMTGCGGSRTVRVTLDNDGTIALWCNGTTFSLGSTTTTSCDAVLFELRAESVVAQPGNCCDTGNCSLRVAVTL